MMRELKLVTVCEEARCPNKHECWAAGTATFMILGDTCTRRCGFCAIATGRPQAVDPGEPARLAEAAAAMKLGHVVITSVARDDLPDQGAGQFAGCIEAIHDRLPGSTVEVLTPDFRNDESCLRTVLEAGPDVFNHNLESVRRLNPLIRPSAKYDRSLAVLAAAGRIAPDVISKSGMMLGLGETDDEIDASLVDLRSAGVQLLTLGQYLRPTPSHLPVVRYLHPDEFVRWGRRAVELGFRHAASTPFARSSHHAADALAAARS